MSHLENNYTLLLSHKQIKIYINSILHLAIKTDELIGIQSWVKGFDINKKYIIEFTTKTTTIESEYDYQEKWEAILNLLDKHNIYGNF